MIHNISDERLALLYGGDNVVDTRARIERVISGYRAAFGREPEFLFSAPGRTELGGNHTDHQNGCVLAASVDLDIIAAVSRSDAKTARFVSDNGSDDSVDLTDLSVRSGERGTSAALIRGVAAAFSGRGVDFQTGFSAFTTSNIPMGSGLSSSAAFEVLVGTIINDLYHADLTAEQIAKIGQYAENAYFGKPCGLMDQMASSVGGAVAIDFRSGTVRKINFDLGAVGHALCIIECGAGHENLTDEYAAITREMKRVAGYFGKAVLRDVPENDFYDALPTLRERLGDRAVLRAMHFFDENRRAVSESERLASGDFDGFLKLVKESERSSETLLQNIVPSGASERQELLFTIAWCRHILNGSGAVRVHGGGFGGTAQAFVPLDMLGEFKSGTERIVGKEKCRVLSIRPEGGVRLC